MVWAFFMNSNAHKLTIMSQNRHYFVKPSKVVNFPIYPFFMPVTKSLTVAHRLYLALSAIDLNAEDGPRRWLSMADKIIDEEYHAAGRNLVRAMEELHEVSQQMEEMIRARNERKQLQSHTDSTSLFQ